MNNNTPLVRYNAACQAVAAARSTDEVKGWRDRAEAMRAYAHQSKNRQLEIDAAEIRIRAERRLGQLITEQKTTAGLNTGAMGIGKSAVPVGNRTPTLAEIGVSKKLSSHSQKIAAIPEAEFEDIVENWRDALETENERVTTNIISAAERAKRPTTVTLNTGKVEWYTPTSIIETARAVLGGFDLDPASSERANEIIRAAQIFTAEDDGLSQDWPIGRIWMNPPYAANLVGNFINRFCAEVGRGSSGIVLVNNATETGWFQELLTASDAVCFHKGRLKFVCPNKGDDGTPLQGQAIFYAGSDAARFVSEFSRVGTVLRHA